MMVFHLSLWGLFYLYRYYKGTGSPFIPETIQPQLFWPASQLAPPDSLDVTQPSPECLTGVIALQFYICQGWFVIKAMKEPL